MLISTPAIVQFARFPLCIALLFPIFAPCTSLAANNDLSIKIRLQPRLDLGPITPSADRTTYASGQDAYLRRVRLEIIGRPRLSKMGASHSDTAPRLHYIVAFSADRWDQQGKTPAVILGYALINYRFTPALNLQFGLAKLPYSRGLLASSSRLLLPERAAISDLAGRFYKYFAPHLVLHGKLAAGTLAYHLTLTDGLQPGDSDRAFSGQTVLNTSTPVTALRLEFSPPSWIEKRQGDAHLGTGRHLVLGFNTAYQGNLELTNLPPERRLLLGTDLSFHHQSLSLGAEYLFMQRDNTTRTETTGWYAQAGYFINSHHLEPAFRLGRIIQNSNTPNTQTRIFTAGLNWYIDSHNLKFQTTLTHHLFDKNAREVTNKDSKTTLQIQNQLYF
jgi:hypothetical protein